MNHTPELKATVFTWNQNPLFALLSATLLIFTLLSSLKETLCSYKNICAPLCLAFHSVSQLSTKALMLS